MDGTLFSTQDLIVHCVNETSQKYLKRGLPRQDSLWSFGPPASNVIRKLAESLPDRPIQEAIVYYDTGYRNTFPDMAVASHGVRALLVELDRGVESLGVVTSAQSRLS